MKAVIITRDKFMRYMEVNGKPHYLRSLAIVPVNINPIETPDHNEIVPIIEYRFERSYINEFDEETLIYKEI